jgi:hypothetical protein
MQQTDVWRIIDQIEKHCVEDERGCLIWTRSKRGNGYAQLTLAGRRQVYGHRAAYMAYVGEIPAGKLVLHKCDVPACCNPDHLFVGTPKDNTRDCVSKGRLRPRNGGLAGRKIPANEFKAILDAYASGETQKDIAAKYGVTQPCISQILLRKRRVDYPAN